jgi:integrase
MPRRRSRGEGSIRFRKDKNLWVAQFTYAPGKKKTKYGKTQAEVRKWLEEQKRLANEGMLVIDSKITFGDFLKRWYDEVARHNLRDSTLMVHETMMRRHILPALGEIKLAKLATIHIQSLCSKKLDEGLSVRTVKYVRTIVHQALAQALKWGLVARNVATAVELPSGRKHKVEALTKAQVSQLLKALEGDRLYAYYVLVISTGLRRGEALALTVDCLDLDQGVVRVEKTLSSIVGKGLVVGEPKSERSRRKVALPDFTRKVLAEHLANRQVDSAYVFCTSKGTPFGPRNIMRHFKTVLARAGLPQNIRIHDLRHTFVSYQLAAGTPASDVQKIVGHASFSTTVDIYGHLMDGAHEESARKMDSFFDA